ncbi:MAG: PEP-CTERM sorting domain-containing protein [Fimbriimonadaceae bacterium]|nr:MAG: PEP-CTERM sorting domain-containing protein [Fimbriimonadaceae bacterium]
MANGINNLGQVVGTSDNATGNSRGFVYSGGSLQSIGTFGGANSFANAINDAGTVVGGAELSSTVQHAFSFSGGTLQDIGLIGGNFSEALGISPTGKIVGMTSINSGFTFRPFLYSGGTMTNLGSLGGSFGYALDMNAAGNIVGDSNTASEAEHGFYYSGGVMTDVGTLLGGFGSTAKAINSSNLIVGYSYHFSSTPGVTYGEAFTVQNGVMTSLGLLNGVGSLAYDVNSAGDITGTSVFGLKSNSRAFYWTQGTMYDLNSLMDSTGAGWTIMEGSGINDNGLISATAMNSSGAMHAVLLTPVPEPATFIAFGVIGVVGVMRRRRSAK